MDAQTRSPSDEDARLFQLSAHSSEHMDGTLNFDGVGEDVVQLKRQQKNREIILGNQPHQMPMGWKACHCLRLEHLLETENVGKDILVAASKSQCHTCEKQRIILGTFGARWPKVADTAIEQLLLAGGIQLASQTSLFQFGEKSLLKFDDITEALEPSRTSISNAVISTAAHMVIVNAERLPQSKKVYLGCDKGGGVLIKMAFFWDVVLKRSRRYLTNIVH
eukprot:scaffold111104_cov54-Attheya_sp.AAC.1